MGEVPLYLSLNEIEDSSSSLLVINKCLYRYGQPYTEQPTPSQVSPLRWAEQTVRWKVKPPQC